MGNRTQYARLECEDGFTVSVQASHLSYCTPRKDDAVAYTHVECGYPSQADDLLTPYAEDKTDLTGTVYGWVPASVIFALVAKHRGQTGGSLPPLTPEKPKNCQNTNTDNDS